MKRAIFLVTLLIGLTASGILLSSFINKEPLAKKRTTYEWHFYYGNEGFPNCDASYWWLNNVFYPSFSSGTLPKYYYHDAAVGEYLYTDSLLTSPAPGGNYMTYGPLPLSPNLRTFVLNANGMIISIDNCDY